MFKFFKKKEEDGGELKISSMKKGLIYGGAAALVVVIIILAVVFWPWNKGAKNTNTAADSKLKVTIITKKDCTDCFDVNLLLDALKQNNAKITKQTTEYLGDKDAQKLIDKYKITKVPTVLISGDLDKNPTLQNLWKNLGEVIDKVFVFRQVIPPYIDVASGQLKGKITVTYLTDQSCKTCYDVKLHEVALKNLGIEAKDTKTVDISSAEGKDLVSKYKIDKVPTILLSGEVVEYQQLVQLWPTYGKITDDKTYIFTKLDVMGTYMDLAKDKVVEVDLQQQPATTAPVTQ